MKICKTAFGLLSKLFLFAIVFSIFVNCQKKSEEQIKEEFLAKKNNTKYFFDGFQMLKISANSYKCLDAI